MLLVFGALLLLFCTLDVWYFLRGVKVFVQGWFQPRIWDILAEQSIDGMVLPHDLDYMGHMNNSRYLRECDFARFHHYMRNGLFMASFWLRAKMVVGASTIRYRRSLAFREAFEIRTKILGWDEKAFYLEQRFVSKKDGFVSAVMLCRQNVVRCSPESIIEYVCKRKVSNGRRWSKVSVNSCSSAPNNIFLKYFCLVLCRSFQNSEWAFIWGLQTHAGKVQWMEVEHITIVMSLVV